MVLPELTARGKPVEMPSDDSEPDWIYAADAWWRALVTPAPPRLVYNLASAARLKKSDPQLGKSIADPAHDQTRRRRSISIV
ncbi:MAG: hypothetical protein ACREQ4_15045 [Candidatus Binataceae bacterium]